MAIIDDLINETVQSSAASAGPSVAPAIKSAGARLLQSTRNAPSSAVLGEVRRSASAYAGSAAAIIYNGIPMDAFKDIPGDYAQQLLRISAGLVTGKLTPESASNIANQVGQALGQELGSAVGSAIPGIGTAAGRIWGSLLGELTSEVVDALQGGPQKRARAAAREWRNMRAVGLSELECAIVDIDRQFQRVLGRTISNSGPLYTGEVTAMLGPRKVTGSAVNWSNRSAVLKAARLLLENGVPVAAEGAGIVNYSIPRVTDVFLANGIVSIPNHTLVAPGWPTFFDKFSVSRVNFPPGCYVNMPGSGVAAGIPASGCVINGPSCLPKIKVFPEHSAFDVFEAKFSCIYTMGSDGFRTGGWIPDGPNDGLCGNSFYVIGDREQKTEKALHCSMTMIRWLDMLSVGKLAVAAAIWDQATKTALEVKRAITEAHISELERQGKQSEAELARLRAAQAEQQRAQERARAAERARVQAIRARNATVLLSLAGGGWGYALARKLFWS